MMVGRHENFGIPDLGRASGEHHVDASSRLLGDSRSVASRVVTSNNLVTEVTYPDGKSRQFEYDEKGSLKTVIQPNGEKWSRSQDGWVSDKGRSFAGEIRVEPDGQYVTTDRSGVRRTYLPDGTKKVFEFSMSAIRDAMARLHQLLPSLKKDFEIIDTDKNGFLSKAELGASISKPSFSQESRLAATGLLLGHETVMSLANDGKMDGTGISLNDLKRYGAAMETTAPDWAERNIEYVSFGVAGATTAVGIASLITRRSPGGLLFIGATSLCSGILARRLRHDQEERLDQKMNILSMIGRLQ